MENNFDRVIAFILSEEGGYSLNPQDPGGETKYGISKRAHPSVDIKALTVEQAKSIYRADYWDKLGLDTASFPMALVMMDCGVNQGVARAKAFAASERVVGKPFVEAFQAERALHYASLPTFAKFGRGWMRRLIRGSMEAARWP